MYSCCFLFLPLALLISSAEASFYAGLSVSGHSVKPDIKWTNVFRQWIDEQLIRKDAAWDTFNDIVVTELPEESLLSKQFANVSPEISLYNKTQSAWGVALWCGFGKMVPSRFYYSVEGGVTYKKLSIDTADNKNQKNKESQIKTIQKIPEDTFFYRHILNGDVVYSSIVKYKKYFEFNLNLRLGYCPTNRFMGTIFLGVGIHPSKFDQVFATTVSSSFDVYRINDDQDKDYWQNDYFNKNFPKGEYKVIDGTYYCASLNLGAGVDYFVTSKTFVRCEYQYKTSFSRTLRSSSDALPTSDLYASYSLRYQDHEHCLSFGLGRRF